MRLIDYIESSMKVEAHQMNDLLTSYLASKELPFFAHIFASSMNMDVTDRGPKGWGERYFENEYYLDDPVIDTSLKINTPFSWDSPAFVNSCKGKQTKIMLEASSYGMTSGLSVPLPSFGSGRGVVSFATDSRRTFNTNDFRELQIAALHFHMRKIQTAQFPIPKLSQRQLECLKWAADGKTTWETSCILNISEATVREHLIRASHVLGTTNKIAAVARAVHLGLVVPS